MLRIVALTLAYLIVGVPVGWALWHLSAGFPLPARLAVLGAWVLGIVDGRRRRRARKLQTFRDFAD